MTHTAIELNKLIRQSLWDTLAMYDTIGRELVQLYILCASSSTDTNVDKASERVERLVRLIHDGEDALTSVQTLFRDRLSATSSQRVASA